MKNKSICAIASLVVIITIFHVRYKDSDLAANTVAVKPTVSEQRRVQYLLVSGVGEKRLATLQKQWDSVESEESRKIFVQLVSQQLLASDEMASFMQFFLDNGHSAICRELSESVEKLFHSDRASEARATLQLMACDDENKTSSAICKRKWSYEAGITCPADEFEAFISALDDISARNATYGQSVTLADKDTLAALQSALAVYPKSGEATRSEGGIKLDDSDNILIKILKKTAVNNLEMSMLLLPKGAHIQSYGLDDAYSYIVTNLAEKNLTDTTQMVLNHKDRFKPSCFWSVVRSLPNVKFYEWIRDLPTGEYYDQAMSAKSPPCLIVNQDENEPPFTHEEYQTFIQKTDFYRMHLEKIADGREKKRLINDLEQRIHKKRNITDRSDTLE